MPLNPTRSRRAATALEALICAAFLVALACVMANRVPFWNGMTALMAVAAPLAALRLRAAERPIFHVTLLDTALGLGLALATWVVVRGAWSPLVAMVPAFAGGLVLVGGYAAHQPPAWAAATMVLIAVAEELVWRGYFVWRLSRWLGYHPFWSAGAGALLYASVHTFSGSWPLAAAALGFGTMWGLLSAWRRGPWAAIVWHACFDLLIFAVAPPPWAVTGI